MQAKDFKNLETKLEKGGSRIRSKKVHLDLVIRNSYLYMVFRNLNTIFQWAVWATGERVGFCLIANMAGVSKISSPKHPLNVCKLWKYLSSSFKLGSSKNS